MCDADDRPGVAGFRVKSQGQVIQIVLPLPKAATLQDGYARCSDPNHEVILLLLCNCNSVTVMNHIETADMQGPTGDPKAENHYLQFGTGIDGFPLS